MTDKGGKVARKHRKRDDRDTREVSTPSLAPQKLREKTLKYRLNEIIRSLEDRRRFTPEIARPARALYRSSTRLVPYENRNRKQQTKSWPSNRIAFAVPQHVAVCVRRKERREILFAHGKGGGKVKPGRWSEFSDITCENRTGHRIKRR